MNKRLDELIGDLQPVFPERHVVDCLSRLCELDRYQVSEGAEAAAMFIAERAREAGLQVEVSMEQAGSHWWTFLCPPAWTPRRALLRIGDGCGIVTSYPAQDCSLARHSCSTPSSGIDLPLVEWTHHTSDEALRGALVVFDGTALGWTARIARLEAAGAIGVVTSAFSRSAAQFDASAVGRFELPWQTKLVGFSVSVARMPDVVASARLGHKVRVEVDAAASGRMPIVAGCCPGPAVDEIWLLAHLCHARPAASDNGAGVAALLGIAECVSRRVAGRGRTVRFLWAPEMVGTAAFLHRWRSVGRPLPRCVIDLDTIGGLAGSAGPLCVERTPSHLPSCLPALMSHSLRTAAEMLQRGDSSLPVLDIPFSGLSDHMLFADRSINVPSVCVGQHSDRLKHSSIDDMRRIDPGELTRVGVATSALVEYLCMATETNVAEVEQIVRAWARFGRGGTDLAYLEASIADSRHLHADRRIGFQRAGPPHKGPVYVRRWDGPFNLYGLLSAVPASERLWFENAFDRDRGLYADALAVALAVDDFSGSDEVCERAFASREHKMRLDFPRRFLDLMRVAGWVELRTLEGHPVD